MQNIYFPYLENTDDSIFQSSIIDVTNSREDLQKFLLGSTDIGNNIQEGINLIVTNDSCKSGMMRLFVIK